MATTRPDPHAWPTGPAALAVVRCAHPGPAVVVTLVAALLAAAADLSPARALTVVAAVLTSQLSIGWSNDLLDRGRDATVHRPDKPLANGDVSARLVRALCGGALAATVVLSLLLGPAAGLANLVCTAAGWVYNLGVKGTRWSWTPYAVAFGLLPAIPTLAGDPALWPPAWGLGAGAALGVGAHLVNALPDLADDRATGVLGLPQRLGARRATYAATLALALGSVLAVLGPPGRPGAWAGAAAVVVAALVVVALVGRGRVPFQAAMGIALVDVLLLVTQ